MTSYIDTKIITLTSQSATVKKNDTYLSNLRYELGMILKDDKDIIHRQIQLLNAQIPYSFYVINFSNHLLKYITTGGEVQTYIPVGNYTANSLITALNTAMGNDPNLTITISPINGRLTFTHTSSVITIYNNFQYSIGSVLGFPPDSTNSSIGFILEANYPLNLLGIKVLQVRSGTLSMNNISSVQGGHTTLLSSIPVSAVPFGMIEYNDVGNNLITITNTTLDDLDIDIIDGESGEYINFNNQDWCITLALHITRIFQPFQPLAKVEPNTNKTSGGFVEPNIESKLPLVEPPLVNQPLAKVKAVADGFEPKVDKNLEELNLLTN
jgi:hypothetical protein